RLSDDLRIFYDGTFFGLLSPFALLCGLVSVAMLVMHGAAWLIVKTRGPVRARARAIGSVAALLTLALFALGGVALWAMVDGYRVVGAIDPAAVSNPLRKTVEVASGAWFDNYRDYPLTQLAPALGGLGALLAFVLMRARHEL